MIKHLKFIAFGFCYLLVPAVIAAGIFWLLNFLTRDAFMIGVLLTFVIIMFWVIGALAHLVHGDMYWRNWVAFWKSLIPFKKQ